MQGYCTNDSKCEKRRKLNNLCIQSGYLTLHKRKKNRRYILPKLVKPYLINQLINQSINEQMVNLHTAE